MARPRQDHPTPGELEVLQILCDRGPSTVREVMEILNHRRRRAYTSVMSLLGVMAEKKLVRREPRGRAFLYHASVARQKTLGRVVRDLLGRVFEGSAQDLVAHLLDEAKVSPEDLHEIRTIIEQYEKKQDA